MREFIIPEDYVEGGYLELEFDYIERECQELIRCNDCKYNPKTSYTGCPMAGCMSRTDEWYCSVGKPKENEK
jgi:hypothetical protein